MNPRSSPTVAAGVEEWQGFATPTIAANPSLVGIALYAPMFYPVKVHACGVQIISAADAGGLNNLDYTFRHNPSNTPSAGGTASDNILVVGTPSNNWVTAAAGGDLRTVYRRVTKNVIVRPGQCVKVLATGAPTSAGFQIRCGLLVSPAWDVPENVTQMVSSVT